MYQEALFNFRMGYGAAIATILFLIMDIYIAWFLYRLFKNERSEKIMFPTPIQNYSLKINIGYRFYLFSHFNLVVTTNSCYAYFN